MLIIPTIIAVFVISIITQVAKKYIYPKFGVTGIQLFAFFLAAVYVVGNAILDNNPAWLPIVEKAVGIFAGAIAAYEVILSKIGAQTVTEQTK